MLAISTTRTNPVTSNAVDTETTAQSGPVNAEHSAETLPAAQSGTDAVANYVAMHGMHNGATTEASDTRKSVMQDALKVQAQSESLAEKAKDSKAGEKSWNFFTNLIPGISTSRANDAAD